MDVQLRKTILAGLGALAALAGPAMAATPGWQVAETAHFRLHGDLPEADLRRQAALLEDFRSLLGMLTNASPPADQPRLDIYIVRRISEAAPFQRIGTNVAGFYSATDNGIAAYADLGDVGQTVLLHEYAHHYMLGLANTIYPPWYVEGFAEYMSTARFLPDRIEFGLADRNRAEWLVYEWEGWMPIERLLARDGGRARQDNVAMFYAQSWLLTHYMFRAPGMLAKLGPYLKAVAAGTDPVAAFKTHVDPDLRGFQQKLRTYIRSRSLTFSRFARPASTPASVTIRELPASASRLLLMQSALDLGRFDTDDKDRALARVRKAAEPFPGDLYADKVLALAEQRLGDPAAAARQLDTLLKATPADADLLRWRAELLLDGKPDDAARKEARRLLARAFKAAPDDWRVMHAYVHSFDIEHGPVRQDVQDVLGRAVMLAPQADGLVIDVATVLVQAGRSAEAAEVLAPVAHQLHGGPVAAWAGLLRDRAAAGDLPGYVKVLDGKVAALDGAAGKGPDKGE